MPAVVGASAQTEQGVPDALRQALLAGEWDKALAELSRLESDRPAALDWWTYLRGTTLMQAKRAGEAIEAFASVERRDPPSEWRTKARFAHADALRELGRAKEAEAIYEEEARRLLSETRQEEIAAIYFGFADQLSTPPPAGSPERSTLDYNRAGALYLKVLGLEVSAATRERALYRRVVCQMALSSWNEAVAAAAQYRSEFDPLTKGSKAIGEHVFEVLFKNADALRRAQDFRGARRAFEDVSAAVAAARKGDEPWSTWRNSTNAQTLAALETLDGEALFAIAGTYLENDSHTAALAVAALRRFLAAYPAHKQASQAAFDIGMRQRASGRTEEALATFDAFLAQPDPAGLDSAQVEALALLRMSALFQRAEVLAQQKKFDAAIAVYNEYIARFPTGPNWTAAQQKIVETENAIGATLRERKQFAEAREAWNGFLARHPLDGTAPAIHALIGESFIEQADALKALAKKEAREPNRAELDLLYRSAITQWRRCVAKYPQSDTASAALLRIGNVEEAELGELDAAVAAYRECNFGSSAGEAAQELARMVQPSLVLVTERVWRSGEAPQVKVQVRNLEKLQLEVYAIDLEAYFRKNLSHRAIEDLDLDLIAADKKLEVPVAGYTKYKRIEQELALPVQGAGVWAVAVTAGDMRATTLVISSDLDVLVRGSSLEALVFVEDMKRGVAAAGVRVLLAGVGQDGTPVVFEVTTGDDGTARQKLGALKADSQLAVFASRDGHVATSGLGARAAVGAPTLTARGIVYTDRPVYRPGESVHWRAILRDVDASGLTFKAGAIVRAVVADAGGQTLWSGDLPLSQYGTVHGEFALDDYAQIGTYRVTCNLVAGMSSGTPFEVQQFQAPKVELTLDTARDVYFRGERVEVNAQATYYWGEPVANSPLRVTTPDGRVNDIVTDAAGSAKFEFETREFYDGPLAFAALLTQEQVQADGRVFVSSSEYRAQLSTVEATYLAGSSFDVTLRTTAPDGEPIAKSLTLDVLRRETIDGTWSETKLESYELATSADGTAHRSLSLTAGGTYLLRASAVDRFGNPVQSELALTISGDDDRQRLRFLVQTHQWKVGERASFDLVNRTEPGLALVTIESDTILEHRIVALAKGSNAIELAIDNAHFPNFTVAASLMRKGELLVDATELQVTRELVVTIKPERELVRPGEKVGVVLKALDQLGRPVQAELSLAIFDEAVLALFPDKTPALRGVFEASTRRSGAFATTSSCSFRYDGETRVIAEALVAEAKQQLERARWKEERAQTLGKLGEIAYASNEPLAVNAAASEWFLGGFDKSDQQAEDGIGQYGAGAPSAFVSRRSGGGGRGGGGLGQGGGGGRGSKMKAGHGSTVPTAIAENPPEFALWMPSIVTDAKGEARIEFTTPATSTRWKLISRGADVGTLVGEAAASLVSKDEFFVDLRAPLALVEGDAPRLVARVHNLTGLTGTARLVLRAANGADSKTYVADVELGALAEVEATFAALDAAKVGPLKLALEVTGELSGVAREGSVAATISARPYRPSAASALEIDVRPWGLEFAASKSGVLRGTASFALELDQARKYGARSLELTLGPSVDGLLTAAALGEDGANVRGPSDSYAAAASQLLGACAMLDVIERSGAKDKASYVRMTQRAQALVARLVGTQTEEGSWPWIGATNRAHVETSCAAMVALARARSHGLEVPQRALDRGIAYLDKAFREASQQADEIKAMLSWALCSFERGDFGALNRLHRERARLSPAALAYTALALAAMDKGPMALELAETLEAKAAAFATVDTAPACRFDSAGNSAWNRSQVEMTALAALALESAKPKSDKLAPAIEFLLAHRPWFDGRTRGLAVAAVATFRGRTEPATQNMRVIAKIGAAPARTIELSSDKPGELLRIELDAADASKLPIELTLEGRGAPHFTAVLRGFSSDFRQLEPPMRVDAHDYLAAAPRYAGREIETGFGVLQDSRDSWTNKVTELGFGAVTRCSLSARCRGDGELLGAGGDYVVVEIPLPAGARLLEGSVQGGYVRHFEQRGGSLFVHIGQLFLADEGTANYWRSWEVEYTLVGAVPGMYRTLPAVVRSLYEPSRMGLAEVKTLAVLARGEASRDVYRQTPSEQFALGQALFEAGEKEAARVLLQKLIDEFEPRLREDVLRAAASSLLFANIERKSSRDIVRYFEILKEKNPELYIPFEQVMAVGAAYREIDEHERALTIFRATIEETFGKELRVVGTLEEQKELDGALRTMARLCREYPDTASVIGASLTLSDKLLQLAPRAYLEPSLDKKGRTRASLTFEGILELQRFVALHPRDPQAPEAGLNLVTAHLGLADYVTASKLGGEFAAAYTEPRFADAFQYSRAVAEWYLTHDDAALELLKRIATAEYRNAGGMRYDSPNRNLANYILAQIHHARQEYADAASFYTKVETVFPDARETLQGFREKHIALPEVTNARPHEKIELELSHRNIKEAELLVYPVDLMTLYLREKNLSRITQVNLSGIAPTIKKTVALEAKEGMRVAETKVALELAEAGAYLVICRGDDLHASGLVLISTLDIEVKEDANTGRLRVQVLDHASGRFVRDVDVRVIGSENAGFLAGRSDPRGLFTADGVVGNATVIARTGDRQYAFHRGTLALAVQPRPPASPGQRQMGDGYFDNVRELNDAVRGFNNQQTDNEIRKERKGVQIQSVK